MRHLSNELRPRSSPCPSNFKSELYHFQKQLNCLQRLESTELRNKQCCKQVNNIAFNEHNTVHNNNARTHITSPSIGSFNAVSSIETASIPARIFPVCRGFIADNGRVCDETEAGVGSGRRLFSLKVIIRRVKTSMRPARPTFLNRHCARNAFLSLLSFHLFVCCVAASGTQLPGMTLRIGCFDGDNVSA